MKKLYISICAVLLGSATSFGQLQNLGFESWTAGTGYENPDGWFNINEFASQIFISPPVAKVSTDPAEGSYAVSMTTRYCSLCPNFGAPDTIPGFVRQDQTIDVKPTNFQFKYKYNGFNGDAGGAVIEITKWDAMLGIAEVLGQAAVEIDANTTSWESVDLWIDYSSSDMPDSVKITFVSSIRIATGDETYPPSQIGSELIIDDVQLVYPLSVKDSDKSPFNAFMANNMLTIQAEGFEGEIFQIVGLNGQVLKQARITASRMEIPVDELSAGLYFVRISRGGLLHAVKFVK
jgi:hypothetical protein